MRSGVHCSLSQPPEQQKEAKRKLSSVIHTRRTYLGLHHGGSLRSQLLDSLEDIHYTLTFQSLYQNTEGAEYSCSTNPSTDQGKKEPILEPP